MGNESAGPTIVKGVLSFQDVGGATVKPESGFSGGVAMVNGTLKKIAPDGTQSAIGGAGGGTVATVVAGTNVAVDSSDPANPIVSGAYTLGTLQALGVASEPAWDVAARQAIAAWATTTGAALVPRVMHIAGASVPSSTAPSTNDGALEGGAVKSTHNTPLYLVPAYIIQNAKANTWFVRFRAKFAAATGVGDAAYLGLRTVGGNFIVIGNEQALGANWQLSYFNGSQTNNGSGVAVDGAIHNFDIYGNGTSLRLAIDGTERVNAVALANAPTDKAVPYTVHIAGAGAPLVTVSAIAFGTVEA